MPPQLHLHPLMGLHRSSTQVEATPTEKAAEEEDKGAKVVEAVAKQGEEGEAAPSPPTEEAAEEEKGVKVVEAAARQGEEGEKEPVEEAP